MDLGRWPHADDLLDRALALPPEQRMRFLEQAAGDDADLLAALTSVVREADRDDRFLEPAAHAGTGLIAELAGRLASDDTDAELMPPGTRVGQYEIAGLLGRGGMGEVYRAHDTNLHRDVALKLLPGRFARDAQRLARFEREARLLASLSHPLIGAIFDLVEEGGRRALVLELVEGATLADLIDRGPMSLDEALPIARQVVEAVDAAHQRGIVHRDLKPANIKITPDRIVKVLDFGLAKAVQPEGEAAHPAASPALTEANGQIGVIMGTAAYMSPEQVRGEQVDQRSDIWAFGCVLFEMLTGSRAFPGQRISEVIAAVLERPPDLARLPHGTPRPIRRLLRRCLEKEPGRRLGYIGDALLEIDEAAAGSSPEEEPARGFTTSRAPAFLVWGVVGLLAGAGLMLLLQQARWQPRAVPPSRLAVPVPPPQQVVRGFQSSVAISPDGRTIVYRAREAGTIRLYRRSLESLDPSAIPGTDNATAPFFSPDGRWLAFDADGVIKKLALAGGTPISVCDAPGGATGTWLHDGTMVFVTATSGGLRRVPASGGQATPVPSGDDEAGVRYVFPESLPDSQAVLVTAMRQDGPRIAIKRLDSGQTTTLVPGMQARYLPTGHLAFNLEGTLWVAPFDADRLALAGDPVPIVEGIDASEAQIAHFAISDSGALAYLPASAAPDEQRTLVWRDRHGRTDALSLPLRPYTRADLSPEGGRVAVSIREADNTDIWVGDIGRGTLERLTFDPSTESAPVWSPDGREIVFRSDRGPSGIFRKAADGTGPLRRVTNTDGPFHLPYAWTPDGSTVLFTVFRSYGSQGIASVGHAGGAIAPVVEGPSAQTRPQLSPNGRWLAYQSDESGRFEIYVRPYPDVETARWQISTDGGTSPRWGRDGRELFFHDGTAMMAAPVRVGESFAAGTPARLFEYPGFGGRLGIEYDVSPSDGRFLMIEATDEPAARGPEMLILTQHWFTDVETLIRPSR